MSKTAVHMPILAALAASLVVAACSGGSPGSTGTPAAGSTVAQQQAAQAEAQGVPHAEPGLGSNPTDTPVAAAPPPAGAAESVVAFSDPNNMPFVDPMGDGDKAAGVFFAGTWTYNGGYMEQSLGAKQASLTFRQYSGNAFGTPDGTASAHYRADVTAWVYQPSDQYPNMVGAPLGIVGYCPYFKDATHYMLAVAKPTSLEVWAVDGFMPGTTWPKSNLLFSRALATPLQVGTPVAWSVDVDTTKQSAVINANGEQLATVSHALFQNGGQKVALISNGNYVHFQNFKLYKI